MIFSSNHRGGCICCFTADSAVNRKSAGWGEFALQVWGGLLAGELRALAAEQRWHRWPPTAPSGACGVPI